MLLRLFTGEDEQKGQVKVLNIFYTKTKLYF
jgi:hypothetical protein